MADQDPPNPTQRSTGIDRRALAAAYERRIATREFVDILTGAGGPTGPPLRVRWERDVTSLARPGTGGRQPNISGSFEIEATRAVREWLGEPTDTTFRRALLHVWEIPDGEDGIIAARLSGQDVQNHETVFGQIHGLLNMCKHSGLKPRYLIASMRNSGYLPYLSRLDFAFIRERVLAGQCSWVAFLKVDRIARGPLPAALFYEFLQETQTGLFLQELGREVDWSNENDVLLLNMLGSIGQFEGRRIKRRTHDPLIERWLVTGRGWPGAKKLGFKRDAGDWLVVDPKQWHHVKFACTEFGASGQRGGTSVRDLRDALDERGFNISREKLRQLLHDPIYVTGEWSVEHAGVVHPGKTIKLDDPVPADVFERNQRLLAITKGKQRVNPIGHCLLNRLLLTHAACRHLVDKDGKPPIMRASRGTYKHNKCQLPECRGLAVSQPDLDALVIRTLLKLCESPELQAEYEQRADRAISTDYNDTDRLTALRSRLRILEQQEARIRREWLEEGIANGNLDPALRAEALSDIRQDMHACRRQLEYAELKAKKEASRAMHTDDSQQLLKRAREVLTVTAPADADLAQRRLMFVDRALSEIRIGDGEVTLFGPLIPGGGILISGNPLDHAGDVLANTTDHEASASRSVLLRRARGDCEAQVAWRSAPLNLPRWVRPARAAWLDWESALDALRQVHELAEPGFLKRSVIQGLYESIVGEADGRRLLGSLKAHGASVSAAWIAAIGEEASLVSGRRRCESERDVRRVIGAALDHGVRFGPGWFTRWQAFAEEVPWAGSASWLVHRIRRQGLDLDQLIAREFGERGAPPAVLEGLTRGFDDRPALISATLQAADERLEPGRRMTVEAIDRALAGEVWAAPGIVAQKAFRRQGLSWADAVRETLEERGAVVRGRVVPRGERDWRFIVGGAVERGLVADARWRDHWRAVQADGWWLPSVYSFTCAMGGLPTATVFVFEVAGKDAADVPVRLRPGALAARDVLIALRVVSGEQPAGLIPDKRLYSLLAGRADLPSEQDVRRTVRHRGTSLAVMWRDALGTEQALRRGRVKPVDASDLRVMVAGALDAGVRLQPDWSVVWDELIDDSSWIPSFRGASMLARRFGVVVRDIALEISVERGLPTDRLPSRAGPARGSRRKAADQDGAVVT